MNPLSHQGPLVICRDCRGGAHGRHSWPQSTGITGVAHSGRYHFATVVPTLSVVAPARRRPFQRVQSVGDTFRQTFSSSAPDRIRHTLE